MKNLLTIKGKLIAIAGLAVVGMLAMLGLQRFTSHSVHALQETRVLSAQVEVGMLLLRRHEKDFLARRELKYQAEFAETMKNTLGVIDRLEKNLTTQEIDATEARQVRDVLQRYGVIFDKLVKVEDTIGLNEKSGLYGSLRDAVHQAEAKINGLHDNQLLSDMLMLRRHEKDFMLRWNVKYVAEFDQGHDVFASHLAASGNPAEDKTEIGKLMLSYKDRFAAFVAAATEKGLDSKSGILGALRETVHQTETLLTSLQKKLEAIIDRKEVTLSSLAWAVTLGLLVLVTVCVLLVAISVVRPVEHLRAIMQQVAENKDLKLRSDIQGGDEIAQMSDAFNDMIDVFDRSVHEVFKSTVMLSTASEELSMITQNTRDGVQRQQSETEQVATAMNEMTATVQEVARSANDAANASRTADEQSQTGRKLVKETIVGIKSLAGEVENTAEEISQLKTETDNINTVLQVIGGIAEQTNLLALNAAIEAARAGEQGRGFAVVADEVRTLASRSQSSTQEISQIIDRLQNRASTVVDAMEHSRQLAQQCVSQADIAATSLDEITAAVSSISNMNLQIASAAEEQSAVAEEINRNIVNINDVAVASTEAANQTLQTSQSLAETATELQTIVNQFRIEK
jgi:methyl-accepting chemotaxis protein